MFPLKVLEQNPSLLLFSFWWLLSSLVCLALSLPPSSLCLRPHTAPCPRWSSVCPRLSLEQYQRLTRGLALIQHDLIPVLTHYIRKDPIFK